MSLSSRFSLNALLCTGALIAVSSCSAYAKDGAPQASAPAATPPPAASAAPTPAPTAASPKVEKEQSFFVIGVSVNTTAQAESKGDGKIPALWQQFLNDGTSSNIPGKVDDDIYAIYSDYKADQTFSYTIGSRVTSIDKVPAGMVALTIPAGPYAVVPSAMGPLQEVIPALWQKIWTMSPADLGGKRSFKFDYNVLNMQGIDPQNAQVDAYVGLQ